MAGCARTSPDTSVPGPRDLCRLAATSASTLDTVSIGLAEPVDLSHAPVPVNESERLLFRQLFPTLVRVDCQGQVLPGLATSWHRDSTGLSWTFILPVGARLVDGTPVTAHQVSAGWHQRWAALQELGLDSIAVPDQQRLVAIVRDPTDSQPTLFADPRLAVTWVDRLPVRNEVIVRLGPDQPVLAAEVTRSGDLRDALDSGADLVVSRDPAVIEYAAGRPDFDTFALPWDRTYVLLQHPGAEPASSLLQTDSIQRSLAYEAVRASARPAQPPFWWHGTCAPAMSMHVASPTEARLIYLRSDLVARQLAERITALSGDSLQLRAVGLEANAFSVALRQGRDRGYIIALPHRPLAPCAEEIAWIRGARLDPLIDSRPHAVVRRGAPALTVDWDGTLRMLQEPADSNARP